MIQSPNGNTRMQGSSIITPANIFQLGTNHDPSATRPTPIENAICTMMKDLSLILPTRSYFRNV